MLAIRYHHNPAPLKDPAGPASLAAVANLYAHKFGLGVDATEEDLTGHAVVREFRFSEDDHVLLDTHLRGNARMIAANTILDQPA
ncbi:MAG: hypothetical protein M5R36_27880 [Deltaproteobacteria bacterium]|nr:hypothetical protein [Deltaproteobacteria bacterium]